MPFPFRRVTESWPLMAKQANMSWLASEWVAEGSGGPDPARWFHCACQSFGSASW